MPHTASISLPADSSNSIYTATKKGQLKKPPFNSIKK